MMRMGWQRIARVGTWLCVGWLCVGLLGACSSPTVETCQTDADCPFTTIRRECRGNVCVGVCDRSCVRDSDCDSCAGGSYRCENGACRGVADTGEQADTYEQCGASLSRTCKPNNTCRKPSATATTGFCYLQCDSKESSCDDGKGTCISLTDGDICLPKGTASLHAPCGLTPDAKRIDLNRLCQPSLQCVVVSSESNNRFCLASCDPQKVSCDNDNGRCAPLTDNTGACLPLPQANEGDACVTLATAKTLDPKTLCKDQFYCDDTCKARPQRGSYEKCDATTSCGTQGLCIVLQQGATTGYCLPLCTNVGQPCESNTGTCIRLRSGQSICLPGTASDGDACGEANAPDKLDPARYCKVGLRCTNSKCEPLPKASLDEVCTSQISCKEGLRCITFASGSTTGVCMPTVSQCSADACATGRVCLSGTNEAICARDCTQSDTSCPSPLQCVSYKNGDATVRICATP